MRARKPSFTGTGFQSGTLRCFSAVSAVLLSVLAVSCSSSGFTAGPVAVTVADAHCYSLGKPVSDTLKLVLLSPLAPKRLVIFVLLTHENMIPIVNCATSQYDTTALDGL